MVRFLSYAIVLKLKHSNNLQRASQTGLLVCQHVLDRVVARAARARAVRTERAEEVLHGGRPIDVGRQMREARQQQPPEVAEKVDGEEDERARL